MGFWSDMVVLPSRTHVREARVRPNPKIRPRHTPGSGRAGSRPEGQQTPKRPAGAIRPQPKLRAAAKAARVWRAADPGVCGNATDRSKLRDGGQAKPLVPEGIALSAQLDVAIHVSGQGSRTGARPHQPKEPNRRRIPMICSARQPCGCRAHRSERCTAPAPSCTPEGALDDDRRFTLSTRRMACCQAFGERPRDPLQFHATRSRRSEPSANPKVHCLAPPPEDVSMAGVPSTKEEIITQTRLSCSRRSEGDPRVRRPSESRPKPALARPQHRNAEVPDAEASGGTRPGKPGSVPSRAAASLPPK